MSQFFSNTLYPEPSAGLVFTGGTVDRRAENRAADCLEQAFENDTTKAMMFAQGRVLVDFSNTEPNPLFTLAKAKAFKPAMERSVLLGFNENSPVLAIPCNLDLNDGHDSLPDPIKAIDYRSLAIQGLLPQARMGEVAQGAALISWHASHRYCSKCGHESIPADGGYKRRCPNCATDHFPRTDPVVIMLAIDRERCLLGRNRIWAEGMYSALAGFVEPGETFEAAVRREISEEAGIAIGKVQYQANQPWPFPYSLMIGCFAEATSTNITIDDEELDDCRWFGRDEILEALDHPEKAGFYVPPKMAIAHHLIDHWARWCE